ncbi:radical SAM protein [Desulfobacterales bacterium HSG16]|nr:radical SAM protein [Desulfobacterales bacterium HSG16]
MKRRKHKVEYLKALVANDKGDVFDLDNYAATGADGSVLSPLTSSDCTPMPYGSEIMYLPDRKPVLWNIAKKNFETLHENPYEPGTPVFPAAAFNSPGYMISHTSSYEESADAGYLPLFSYGAVGWSEKKGFMTAVIQVDKERRQDLRLMKPEKIAAGIRKMQKAMPSNRLEKHLENCALKYGCPAGKNFFLGRYEAPLPTSRACNARCLGCISLQADQKIIPSSQNRINFTPSPEEIKEVALSHILRVKNPVVSFGQGCEGDPLLAADAIIPAISMIREKTDEGTINMNTNGSCPDILEGLFDAGLDSIRISINSVRKSCYNAYFRPVSYKFEDVLQSIDLARQRGKFVSINYLNCPGITDSPEESDELFKFLKNHRINMIQWRNLNFDPLRYMQTMNQAAPHSRPTGMKPLLEKIRKNFPQIRYGYFNPPKEKYGTSRHDA